MPDDPEKQGHRIVEIEAYRGTVPHPAIIKGYQDAIQDGGMEVIAIVRRQQLFNFIVDMAGLLTSNIIPMMLVLPILVALSVGALIEITIVASVPMALFTAGSANGKVVTTVRAKSAQSHTLLRDGDSAALQHELPATTDDKVD